MLGLGSASNKDEAYGKGERYRERFHSANALNTSYNETTNPIGREGLETYYIGDFSAPAHDDAYGTEDVAGNAIDTGEFKFRCAASTGYTWITFSVVPYTRYVLKATWDPTDRANGNGKVSVGTSHGATDISASDVIENTSPNEDITLTFNAGNNKYLYLSLHIIGGGKWAYYDDISLKEA